MDTENNTQLPISLDSKVQKLFDIIQKKKANLATLERPNYKTNLSFIIDENDTSKRINLLVINDSVRLLKILAGISLLKKEFDTLSQANSLELEFTYSGYSFDDWLNDITTLINRNNIKRVKDDLAIFEGKLSQLVSPEEKRRMEIEALEKELL